MTKDFEIQLEIEETEKLLKHLSNIETEPSYESEVLTIKLKIVKRTLKVYEVVKSWCEKTYNLEYAEKIAIQEIDNRYILPFDITKLEINRIREGLVYNKTEDIFGSLEMYKGKFVFGYLREPEYLSFKESDEILDLLTKEVKI